MYIFKYIRVCLLIFLSNNYIGSGNTAIGAYSLNCNVHGYDTEMGYVSFREIEPYILCWSEPSVYFEHAY